MTGRRIVAPTVCAEHTRRRYRPPQVRVLMVAESPPASGRFFYHADSGLYRAVRDAFASVHVPTTGRTFLESFRDRGWYLVDLCPTPVNHCQPRTRRRAHEQGVFGLARTLRRLRPHVIVLVVKMIGPAVRRALRVADWSGQYFELPYPGRWAATRRDFETRFRAVLVSLARQRVRRCRTRGHHTAGLKTRVMS